MHKEHKPSDETDLLITTVNDGDFGFKVDTCKLQKQHSRYGEGQVCGDELVLQDTKLLQYDSEIGSMLADIEKDENKKPFGNSDDPDFVKALEFA